MIPKETIDNIFETAQIEEVVSEFVNLKKRGANLLGLCPFHDEKTPSFTVSPTKGIYKCFGCGKGGNVVNFVMEHEGLRYPEALHYLAKKYNIEIQEKELTPEQVESQNERESLFLISEFAQDFFHQQLMETEDGRAIGLSYFKERGYDEEIVKKFGLGYSPEDKKALAKAAKDKGYKTELLEKAGLCIERRNELIDRFYGRVMFPIHSLSGRVIAFGGRTLRTDKKTAKYINSPETDIYNKSKVLYGIYQGKKAIIGEDNCFLVEGYTDVVSMHQAGVENVVASSGTSLTTEQIKLIKRYTPNITILYDGDAAGIKASFRGIDLILEEGLNVKVVLFPEGEDPDSYSKKVSEEELKEFIGDNAQDFITFKTNQLMEGVKDDPIKKAELIREIVNSIALIPDPITRSIYVQQCARLMNIGEEAILSELNKVRRKNFNQKNKISQREAPVEERDELLRHKAQLEDSTDSCKYQERDVLRILLNFGDRKIEVKVLNEEDEEEEILVPLAEYVYSEIETNNISFENKVFQQVYDTYKACIEKDTELPTEKFFVQHENPELSKVCVDFFTMPYHLSDNWEKKHHIYVTTEDQLIRKSIEKAVYSLKEKKLYRKIADSEEELKNTSEEDKQIEIMERIAKLNELKKQISSDQLGRVVLK